MHRTPKADRGPASALDRDIRRDTDSDAPHDTDSDAHRCASSDPAAAAAHPAPGAGREAGADMHDAHDAHDTLDAHAVRTAADAPPWPWPRWVAHRGAGKLAPENTLAALRLGAQLGYRAFECDVQLSADGLPFLLHDATLARTSSGRGLASALPWAQLSQLDAGSWHGRSHAGEPLPTLAAVAAWVRANGLLLNIEIKPAVSDDGAAASCASAAPTANTTAHTSAAHTSAAHTTAAHTTAAHTTANRTAPAACTLTAPHSASETGAGVARAAAQLWAGAGTLPLLSSFSTAALAAAQASAPALPRALLLDRLWPGWEQAAAELAVCGVIVHHRLMDLPLRQHLRAHGWRAGCYTVNDDADVQRLQALDVDSLITDAVDRHAPLP